MEDWIVIVDDDAANLKVANHIFTKAGIRARYFKSGLDMLDYLDSTKVPALILLDIHMPEIDGYEVLRRLRRKDGFQKIPVIFLTADDDVETEKRCLDAGAADFVKKPFAADVLLRRVHNTISLFRLQNDMERQLAINTEKLRRVYMQIVLAMSGVIDAKDAYTKGHSTRVAEYAREIARRAGRSGAEQEQIYVMGLLHDTGKVGIPDGIINKPGTLDDAEYAIIKKHSLIGAQILQTISEFPELSVGARWHHERYDGAGYPDGLSGADIPETARIIAVADTYDAMTSYRSYRESMSQEEVKKELIRCRGTQFDPEFLDIMLQMIEEDTEYQMREH